MYLLWFNRNARIQTLYLTFRPISFVSHQKKRFIFSSLKSCSHALLWYVIITCNMWRRLFKLEYMYLCMLIIVYYSIASYDIIDNLQRKHLGRVCVDYLAFSATLFNLESWFFFIRRRFLSFTLNVFSRDIKIMYFFASNNHRLLIITKNINSL